MMPIKFKLDEIMIERGLTYEDVSQGAKVSTNTLYKMRRNQQKQVGVGVMGRLLDFLDCEPNDLIERTGV